MPIVVEPCDCVSNASSWTKLCVKHNAELAANREAGDLQSLVRLIWYYEKFTNDDNLRHVVTRIRQLSAVIAKNPEIVTWVTTNRSKILDWSKRHAAQS